MIFIDAATTRKDLEAAAVCDCGFSIETVEGATSDELREMIIDWIAAGDECER